VACKEGLFFVYILLFYRDFREIKNTRNAVIFLEISRTSFTEN